MTNYMSPEHINPPTAFYIKLGEGGCWERDCIQQHHTLRIGYHEVPHEACQRGQWDEVKAALRVDHEDPGAVTRHTNQVQSFYEAGPDVLWVTFFGKRLYWCFSRPEVTLLPDKTKTRPVSGQWSSLDITGAPLDMGRLNGKLLSMQGFHGTICSVKEFGYLVQKINGIIPAAVREGEVALAALEQRIEDLIRSLGPKDFEILIDLIFRQAGWQRTGVLGKTEKTIDLDLISPITAERFAVQVKSRADLAEFRSYQEQYADMQGYTRLYFVVHTPAHNLAAIMDDPGDDVRFWGPREIAHWAVKYGLADWIITRAS